MIIALTGKMGSGKTLMMTIFAHKYHSELGSKVYANYGLRFPFSPLRMSDLTDFSHDLNNAVIAADEIHLFLDSRQSMSKKSRIISYFITQSRKRNLIFLYTTQNSHQVDKRLRANTDYVIECRNLSPKDAQKDVFIQYTMTDMNSGMSRTYKFKADPYFKLYDTKQLIDFTDDGGRDKDDTD